MRGTFIPQVRIMGELGKAGDSGTLVMGFRQVEVVVEQLERVPVEECAAQVWRLGGM